METDEGWGQDHSGIIWWCTKFSKGKMKWCANGSTDLSLISGCDTFWEQARTSAKRHEYSTEWICAL
jgi:hypothetical protein